MYLKGVPEEYIILEEPKAYQEHAVFYHRPRSVDDINGQNPMRPAPEQETSFQVEQETVLTDEQYRSFLKNGFMNDQPSCSAAGIRCGLIQENSAGTVCLSREKPAKTES